MRGKKTKKVSWKAPRYFLLVIFVSFFAILAQLIYVSMFPSLYGINMKEFAAARNTYSTKLTAKRGTIYDKKGNVLAQNVASYTVIAYLNEKRTGSSKIPMHVVDKKKTASKLSPLLGMSEKAILKLLNKDAYQVELGPGGRGITELKKGEIQALKLPGIDFVESYKRFYPNGDFASYIIGYAKTKEEKDKEGNVTNKIIGELGLESKYEKELNGKDGYLEYQRDRYGHKIPDTKENREPAQNGADVHLTIDSSIQRFVESAIKDIKKGFKPTWATIAVMNAKTGEILGASTIPSFDPNLKNITDYQSPLVTYTFEPGSTMKTYAYMCAIESGKYNPSMQIATGSKKIGTDIIRDWNRTGWGSITADKGFIYSSNVVASTLVQKVITRSELRDCYEKYGFGEATGVGLAHESDGSLNFTYPIEVASATFGQGITITVMQQLQGLSIIANGGKMVKPRIVDKIVDSNTNKTIYESSLEVSEQLVKPSTASKMISLMNQVVNDYTDPNVTGRSYAMQGYGIIGKTGTAQFAKNTGGYAQGDQNYIFSFAGMYPKKDPEIIIFAAVKQPSWGTSFSVSTAVKEVIKNTSKYLNMFPKTTSSNRIETLVLDSYMSKKTDKIFNELALKGLNVIIVGDGDKIINQYPIKGTKVVSNDKVFLITDGKKIVLPNFVGWAKKDVMKMLDIIKIKYTMEGNGYIATQSVAEGTQVTPDLKIEFTLNDKYDLGDIH